LSESWQMISASGWKHLWAQRVQGRLGLFIVTDGYTDRRIVGSPDCRRVLRNLQRMFSDNFREFSMRFKLEEQSFLASFGRRDRQQSRRKQNEVDCDSLKLDFDFGPVAQEQRQAQVQQQHAEAEIAQITRRAEEVRNMFADLHTLILEQGTVVDRIDYCIAESLTNATEAEEQVRQAARYQGKSRLWICAAILAVLIGILLLRALLR